MAESVSIWLENIYWTSDPSQVGAIPDQDAYLWPVFFTIDGSTIQVTSAGVTGMPATTGTSGTGSLDLEIPQNGSIAIPAAAGQWTGELIPIPVAGGSTVDGYAGVVAYAFTLGHLTAAAAEAGHQAFNSAVQSALEEAMTTVAVHGTLSPQQITALLNQVQAKVTAAVVAKSTAWGLFVDIPYSAAVVAYYGQSQIPSPFDQADFLQTTPANAYESLGVSGSISQARRTVGQGTLSHFGAGLKAVAGYTDPTYKHALVATGNGDITEIWYPGYGGPVGQGTIGQFSSPIVALAGFYSADGYQHAIVGTGDYQVTELWWPGGGAPVGRGTIYTFKSPIVALAAYYSADGYNNVIVAADNAVHQLWWTSGEGAVGQGSLGYTTSPVVGLAGYFADDGAHHVIVATADTYIMQFSWSATAAVSKTMVAQTQSWQSALGAGAYDAPSQGEQHAIIGMADGTVTEFHWTAANTGSVSHDDLFNLAGMQMIAAFYDAGGVHHAIVGTASDDVHELWWSEDKVITPLPGRPGPPIHQPPTAQGG